MVEIDIPEPFLRGLIEHLRARSVRTGRTATSGGEGEAMAMFETGPGDLRDVELREGIDALDDDHRHQLVALIWVGRGDFSKAEWEEAVELAAERDVGPTSRYVMSHPEAGDQLADGLEELGHYGVTS